MQKEVKESIYWHTLSSDKAIEKLKSKFTGLNDKEATKRLEEYGKNEIRKIRRFEPLRILFEQFKSFFVILLILAAIVSAFVAHWIDMYVILGIVILNAGIGFFQNYKAEKSIQALRGMLVTKAKVLRSGILKEIPASEIVPGDILILQEGDKVVADSRIIETSDLQTNEAVLTGESTPVDKETKILDVETEIYNRSNMLYKGTSVVRGSCKALVVATAMQTEFGKIASMVQKTRAERTPLQIRLDSFAKKIGVIVIILVAVIAGLGIYFGLDKVQMFFTAISLAVAAVPEGLPAVITIGLAIAVRRMYRVKSLIRKLPAAETLGRVTVICTDKTGTITEEKMTVTNLYYDNKIIKAENIGEGKVKDKALRLLLKINCLCNNARLEKIDDEEEIIGDPTEAALIRIASNLGFDKKILTEKEPRVKEFAFTSKRKMMSIVRKTDFQNISYVKGSPEVILEKCSKELVGNTALRLVARRRKELLIVYEEMASQGLRVLGFAYKPVNKKFTQTDAESELIFVGFQGMLDPPRPEVKEAIKATKEAGIAVKMITGDAKLTAIAVAKQIGLVGEAVVGREIEKMSDEELKSKIKETVIFARTTPEQKLRIINILKEQKEIVAVTGDGVNDAPALKRADIGVAMGIRGTDVTRDVSDMILTDDNFASIAKAVKEGRRVFDNIKKFSYYLLSSNLAEIFIIVFALLFASQLGWPTMLALLPIQILWINLVSDGIIALTLSLEHPEADVMKRKPTEAKLFTSGIVVIWFLLAILITLGILLSINMISALDAIKLQTVAFTGLVFFEGFNAINFRSFRQSLYKLKANWLLFGAIIISFILQILIVQTPFLQTLFGTSSLTLKEFSGIFLISLSILVVGELFKYLKPKIFNR
ncbi:MAG: HAD-IC family P-type ATPase [Candidatus Pacearchaeota archaeon]|nr:MAG: HAD-IC family P-type ATPase [Candidatus Pacearchaeota archaeon]